MPMRLVLIVPPTGKVARIQRVVLQEEASVAIGGASDCDALIDHPSVGAARVRLSRGGGRVTVHDVEGLGRCAVGGVRLRARAHRIVCPPTSLRLGEVECTIEIEPECAVDTALPTREVALRIVADLAGAASDAPVVRIAEGNRMGEAIALQRDKPCIVGRGNDVDLFLDDPDVSRRHLSVEWREDAVIVTDLGTTGGTYLGSAPLASRRGAVWPPTRMIVAGKTVLLLEATAGELISIATRAALPPEPPPSAPQAVEAEVGEVNGPPRVEAPAPPLAVRPTYAIDRQIRVLQAIIAVVIIALVLLLVPIGWMIFTAK